MQEAKTPQEKAIQRAREAAKDETIKLSFGDLRLRAVELVLIKRTHTYAGAALEVHASEATVQRWCVAFVEIVARHAGFI